MHHNGKTSTEVNVYHKILTDLESYLQHEIDEWNSLADSSNNDDTELATYHALVDIKHQINRLKRFYLVG